MSIFNKLITVFFFTFLSFQVSAHVQHYDSLNRIEFEIYRNNQLIGSHIFSFDRSNNNLSVTSKIVFEIKKFGIVLYKYSAEGVEVYKDGKLVKFNSKTIQNKKEKYVNLRLENNEYIIDGSSFKGKVSNEFVIGTWWNHEIIKAKAQISAVSGRIIHQKVKFIGKEKIKIGGKEFDTLHFNFSSTDKKLDKNKKLNTDVWYDEKTLNWVKASFNKKGKWQYKLISLK